MMSKERVDTDMKRSECGFWTVTTPRADRVPAHHDQDGMVDVISHPDRLNAAISMYTAISLKLPASQVAHSILANCMHALDIENHLQWRDGASGTSINPSSNQGSIQLCRVCLVLVDPIPVSGELCQLQIGLGPFFSAAVHQRIVQDEVYHPDNDVVIRLPVFER